MTCPGLWIIGDRRIRTQAFQLCPSLPSLVPYQKWDTAQCSWPVREVPSWTGSHCILAYLQLLTPCALCPLHPDDLTEKAAFPYSFLPLSMMFLLLISQQWIKYHSPTPPSLPASGHHQSLHPIWSKENIFLYSVAVLLPRMTSPSVFTCNLSFFL